MASVTLWHYYYSSALGPGEALWVSYGPADALRNSAVTVTAVPHVGIGGTNHVLKVENVNVTTVETHAGDITFQESYVGATVTNNGGTTIRGWAVEVGVIQP